MRTTPDGTLSSRLPAGWCPFSPIYSDLFNMDSKLGARVGTFAGLSVLEELVCGGGSQINMASYDNTSLILVSVSASVTLHLRISDF